MKKFLIIFTTIVILIIGVIVLMSSDKNHMNNNYQQVKNEENSSSFKGKIVMIIAFKNFRDEEYFIPKEVFEKNGFQVTTVSTEKGTAIGAEGGEAKVDLSIEELKVDDFDAVVFVGGPGAYKNIDNQLFHQIARETIKKEKILGAICIAPAILARAGVLAGKRATVWSNILDKTGVKILEENGALYEDTPVVKDGNIITANGYQAASEFARKIIESL